jgi:hypothetical protein
VTKSPKINKKFLSRIDVTKGKYTLLYIVGIFVAVGVYTIAGVVDRVGVIVCVGVEVEVGV